MSRTVKTVLLSHAAGISQHIVLFKGHAIHQQDEKLGKTFFIFFFFLGAAAPGLKRTNNSILH